MFKAWEAGGDLWCRCGYYIVSGLPEKTARKILVFEKFPARIRLLPVHHTSQHEVGPESDAYKQRRRIMWSQSFLHPQKRHSAPLTLTRKNIRLTAVESDLSAHRFPSIFSGLGLMMTAFLAWVQNKGWDAQNLCRLHYNRDIMVIFGWLAMVRSTEGCWVMKTERRQLCATIPPSHLLCLPMNP